PAGAGDADRPRVARRSAKVARAVRRDRMAERELAGGRVTRIGPGPSDELWTLGTDRRRGNVHPEVGFGQPIEEVAELVGHRHGIGRPETAVAVQTPGDDEPTPAPGERPQSRDHAIVAAVEAR